MKNVEILPDGKHAFKSPQVITLDERDSTLWINSVFGVSKEGLLPARFLSGFLSTFGLVEDIQNRTKGKVEPRVRIFIPANISQTVNAIGEESIARQIAQGTNLIQKMVKNHFPRVEFFIEKDKPVTDEVMQVLRNFSDLVAANCEDKDIQRIKESGFRRGGKQGAQEALIYASHHVFGWSDLHSVIVFEQSPPFTVINTLPPSDKIFVSARRQIVEHLSETNHKGMRVLGKRFDLFMMMCDRPHYLLITEDSSDKPIEPTVDDLETLTCGEILDVLKRRQEEEKTPWTKDYLRRARIDFEKLMTRLSKGKLADAHAARFENVLKGDL